MGKKMWRVTVPLDDFYYFGLIAVGQKLKKEGKLNGFRGGATTIARNAIEAVVESYIKTGQITVDDIIRLAEDGRKRFEHQG